MAERNHTSPNGNTRFKVTAELSHINLALYMSDNAAITVVREVQQAANFNFFDPSTWFSSTHFVRAGNAGAIVVSGRFEDALGRDISANIAVTAEDGPGYFRRSATFLWISFGTPNPEHPPQQPDSLGTDARSVRLVRVRYRLPWEQTDRELTQT